MTNIVEQLEACRHALLDLSTRNRLLHVPQQSTNVKIINITDELSAEIFRLLVTEGKSLGFLSGESRKQEIPAGTGLDAETLAGDDGEDFVDSLPQPDEDEETDARGVAKRHTDRRLQTMLTSTSLQKRLLTLYYDAITFEQEQGVNILYLALGMLQWYEDGKQATPRFAPLVLVPVVLERARATERFRIRWRGEEPVMNISLQAKMRDDFGLEIPDFPDDDAPDLAAYMQEVQNAVAAHPKFKVCPDKMMLGFFSFAKFLMYRDLDIANWPDSSRPDKHHLISGLMDAAHRFPLPRDRCGEDDPLDHLVPPERIFHVMDADNTQALAIEEVRRGHNLVIQGPPGTGKSQTIANVIANAVIEGKKVLFISEKLAALEVVHRRMKKVGLDTLCLELHSTKSRKRTVLEELKRILELEQPAELPQQDEALSGLQTLREQLNRHTELLHHAHAPSGLSAYQILGQLLQMKQENSDTPDIRFDNAHEWCPDKRKQHETLLAELSQRLATIGTPARHVWCGVNSSQIAPDILERLSGKLVDIGKNLLDLLQDIRKVEHIFPAQDGRFSGFRRAALAADTVARMPEADCATLSHAAWLYDTRLVAGLVRTGLHGQLLKEILDSRVLPLVWQTDLADCRRKMAMYGNTFLRWLHTDYRKAAALLRSLLSVPLPRDHKDRMALLDDIVTVQQIAHFIKENDTTGRALFGYLWHGFHSDWRKLAAILDWRENLDMDALPEYFLQSCAGITDRREWHKMAERLGKQVPAFFQEVETLFAMLEFRVDTGFAGAATIDALDRNDFASRLAQWVGDIESISQWTAFKALYDQLAQNGLSVLADRLWDGRSSGSELVPLFRRAYFDTMTDTIFKHYPELKEFDGEAHYNHIARYRDYDRKLIERARASLLRHHYQNLPRANAEQADAAMRILYDEFARKRNHMPLRQLLCKAGPAIQAIKPVFMMSPLSVAQFLEPGNLQFDLLVIDEASQIEAVDALGAIARARQIVVVGDTNQLPPTRFFTRMTRHEADNDNDEESTTMPESDSILDLCMARGFPQRMLRWHYRSRHPSLMALSNRRFYENRLHIAPSPREKDEAAGLKFTYVPDVVHHGKNHTVNPVEAEAVAQRILRHALDTPELSLGVGTFSLRQRQMIIAELEKLRRLYPQAESFFTEAHSDEPFFIKNLETIQGDERDVVLISVGYARGKDGKLAMRFGPLVAKGGDKRLNVLASRARQRCEVFASITDEDIDTDRSHSAGVEALKQFLYYARTGRMDDEKDMSPAQDEASHHDDGSHIFIKQVASFLKQQGYEVRTNIGSSGFYIDLAIVDPEDPDYFLMAVECDGSNYHKTRALRDRERLRHELLERQGWVIHRIWIGDWYRQPEQQMEKLLAAVRKASASRHPSVPASASAAG